MEDVLGVYTRPHGPARPVVCLDATSRQVLADVRPPLPVASGTPKREDPEYVRHGVANLCLACEPLRGWRHIVVSDRRTRLDWAACVQGLRDVHSPTVERVVLVLDNPNIHSPASLYEADPAAEAKRLADRREIHYTPKHGSGLNMAEIELGILQRQCLDRRPAAQATLASEVADWVAARNAADRRIDWRFTTADARIKPKRLYPAHDN
jgi:hypothetical protein